MEPNYKQEQLTTQQRKSGETINDADLENRLKSLLCGKVQRLKLKSFS